MALPSLLGSARNDGSCKVHFIRARLTVATGGFTAGVKIGRLPARAFINSVTLHKEVAFNSTATDTLALGVAALGVTILAATDIHTTGYAAQAAAAGLGLAVTGTGDVDVFATWVSGGGSPTLGDVTVSIHYTPDNDN